MTNLARHDLDRIPTDDEREVQGWARRLNTSPEQLRAAIRSVGDHVHAVRVHLGHAAPVADLPKAMQNTSD